VERAVTVRLMPWLPGVLGLGGLMAALGRGPVLLPALGGFLILAGRAAW
jgi:hypothetical protein